ncbi:MAG: DUF3696 domain-containing protein [Methanothrix sp.]
MPQKRKIRDQDESISEISIKGFKSLSEESRISIRPLTILAGANSSGKSSIMQPILLLKQTLEASYDPGPLLINGPDVRFTSSKQLLSKLKGRKRSDSFNIEIKTPKEIISENFREKAKRGLEISEMIFTMGDKATTIKPGTAHKDIITSNPEIAQRWKSISRLFGNSKSSEMSIRRSRCFLEIALIDQEDNDFFFPIISPADSIEKQIRKLIHVPALRGNPERAYKTTTSIGPIFPGTFEDYVAGIISSWKEASDSRLIQLGAMLEKLGLTWKVSAKQVDDTQVELQVGRTTHSEKSGARDLVNIADVGFGVSQTLPVLVAILIAEPGQLVYIEQPEIHLHPRAQFAMAEILSNAIKRRVRLIVETHSTLLLLGIQSLVAEGRIDPKDVKLHWFERNEVGITKIYSTDVDEIGAFENWPVDFAEVEMNAENRYINAVEKHLFKGAN